MYHLIIYIVYTSCFELPLWVHENIYGAEDTSDLLCATDRLKEIYPAENI